MFAYFRLDGDLYWALQGATRVLVEYGRDCLPPAGTGAAGVPGLQKFSRDAPGRDAAGPHTCLAMSAGSSPWHLPPSHPIGKMHSLFRSLSQNQISYM